MMDEPRSLDDIDNYACKEYRYPPKLVLAKVSKKGRNWRVLEVEIVTIDLDQEVLDAEETRSDHKSSGSGGEIG